MVDLKIGHRCAKILFTLCSFSIASNIPPFVGILLNEHIGVAS